MNHLSNPVGRWMRRGSPSRRAWAVTSAILPAMLMVRAGPVAADENRNLDHLTASRGTIRPLLDGQVHPEEWSDASVYTLETSYGQRLTLYLKTVPLYDGDAEQCAFYPGNPSFTLPCDDYLWMAVTLDSDDLFTTFAVYVDEGDDGANGSGSGDGVLTMDQEDGKRIVFGAVLTTYCGDFYGLVENCPRPSCVPWDDTDECWKCGLEDTPDYEALQYCYYGADPSRVARPTLGGLHEMMDGWVYGEPGSTYVTWQFVAPTDKSDPNVLGFFGLVGEDFHGAELAMPFHGKDTGGWDASDATFDMGDVLNVFFFTNAGMYPRKANEYTPELWIPVEIGGVAETQEDLQDTATGCAGATRSAVLTAARAGGFASLPLLLAGVAFTRFRRSARARGSSTAP